MANPLETIKKIRGRSWSELRSRGGQAISVYTERLGLTGGVPSETEVWNLFTKDHFGDDEPSLKALLTRFRETSAKSFFPSFIDKEYSSNAFRILFGDQAAGRMVEKAERLLDGKYDLLGYKNLYLSRVPDWHYEPISGKRSPLKHWRDFDELSTDETGDKKVVWELNRHQHFFILGAAYYLTSNEKYAGVFVSHLHDWMDQNPPQQGVNWFSSLEIAFRAMSWLWGLNFFKQSKFLDSKTLLNTMRYLYGHGKHLEKYLSTYYSPNTHLTGEALGLYYLGTQLPFARAKHWRELGKKILLAELDRQLLPDGVYFEQSSWYQRYTADFYIHFLTLQKLSGDDADAALNAKLQKAIDHLMYLTRPDGTSPLVGDDDGGKMLPLTAARPDDFRATLATAAVLFGSEDYKYVSGGFSEETFWLLGKAGIEGFNKLGELSPEEESKSFADGGYFIMRDGWEKTDNYMMIDCGEHGALSSAHSHADILSFELAAGGKTMLVDPGTYTYHKSDELRDHFRSSAAHNTLVIDDTSSSLPSGKFKWRTVAKPEVKSWITQSRFDFFEGSHDGYEKLESPATHTRSIMFLKNDYWIVRDYVETRGDHTYQLNFHFDAGTNARAENPEAKLWTITEDSDNNAGLKLLLFGDNGEWKRNESWVSKCYGGRINAPYLQFRSQGSGPQEFFTFLLPTMANTGEIRIEEIIMAGGRAFEIEYNGYNDLFFFGDGDGQIARNELFATDFRFVWARMAAGESLPEEYVFIDGKHLTISGHEILDRAVKQEFAAARRFGNKLNIRTAENIFEISLPQKRAVVLADEETVEIVEEVEPVFEVEQA